MILREESASDSERHDPALAEIVGVRLLLVNVLRPLAAGEKLAPEAFDKMLNGNRGQEAVKKLFFQATGTDTS